jgi:hypothetical protein
VRSVALDEDFASGIIPLGSQTPFLVRQRYENTGDIGLELVGEAWVEGVMYGGGNR